MGDSSRKLGNESKVKVACCQIEPRIGMVDENLEKTIKWIKKAASTGSQLIILPELCVSGYVFNSKTEALNCAENIPGGRSIESWELLAKHYNIYIVAGIAEKQGSTLYNTSVLIGPEGLIEKYRKIHLWFEEKLFFEQGNIGLPLLNVPFGRLGMMVCYDLWFPEVSRIYSTMGVDIIVVPTNWPTNNTVPQDITDSLIISQSHMNGVFIAACDRVGEERGVRFKGRSIITSNHGSVLAGPASETNEEIIVAHCNFNDSRYKQRSKLNDIMSDRRRDVYDHLLGYRGKDLNV